MKEYKQIKETYRQLATDFKHTGSIVSYTKLYNKMSPGIRNYVFNIVKDYDVAEDLTLVTMSKVYTEIESYNEQYEITTWAYRIAHNEALHYIRKRNKKVSLTYFQEKGFEPDGEASTDGERSLNNGFSEMNGYGVYESEEAQTEKYEKVMGAYNSLVSAIDELDPRYKAFMEDRYLKEMSYKDIELKHNSLHYNKINEMRKEYNSLEKSNPGKANFILKDMAKYKKEYIVNQQTVKNRINKAKQILVESVEIDESIFS